MRYEPFQDVFNADVGHLAVHLDHDLSDVFNGQIPEDPELAVLPIHDDRINHGVLCK